MKQVGEVGEAANIIKKIRRGDFTLDTDMALGGSETAREALAREAAAVALELNPAIEQVVLACLQRAADPVVAVVRR